MTRDEAIQKAMKLLKLAESTNVHEAALAAQRAQEILQRFNISHDILEAEQVGGAKSEPIEMNTQPIDTAPRLAQWKSYLASVVAQTNQCRAYVKQRYGVASIIIVGGASDAQVVRYFYTMLCGEVERLAKMPQNRGMGRTWLNNFRLGVVDAIGAKLKEGISKTAQEMRQEVAHNPAALAKVETALARRAGRDEEILDWMKRYKTTQTRSSHRADHSARYAGQVAGSEISIGGARGALNAAQPRIEE